MPVLSTFLKAPAVALMKSQDRNGLPIEAAGGAPATELGASSASGRRHAKLSKLNYWSGEGARTLDPDLGKVEMLRIGQLHSPASCCRGEPPAA